MCLRFSYFVAYIAFYCWEWFPFMVKVWILFLTVICWNDCRLLCVIFWRHPEEWLCRLISQRFFNNPFTYCFHLYTQPCIKESKFLDSKCIENYFFFWNNLNCSILEIMTSFILFLKCMSWIRFCFYTSFCLLLIPT